MAGAIKHRYQSATADDPTSEISSGEWNDSEIVEGGANGQLFERDSVETDGWKLTATPGSGGGVTQYSVDGGNGAFLHAKAIAEEITLDTGAAFTDSAADLLPANAILLGVVARVTTTITTATTWRLGDANVDDRFSDDETTLAAGTTKVGLNHQKGNVITENAGPTQTAAAKLRITLDGNPGAGAIRVTVFFVELIPHTS